VSSLAAGCGGAPPTPAAASKLTADQPVTAALPAQKPAAPRVMPKVPEPGPPLAPLQYEAKGRRDPFTPVPVAREKSGLDVSTTRLVGVIRGRQLMALVEASDGLGYILRPGDVLGNGRVVDITPGSVTFAVAGRAGQRDTSLTLRLVRE
jgi:Tfp pilus assembly protein PilP